jgi:hypothetical protein
MTSKTKNVGTQAPEAKVLDDASLDHVSGGFILDQTDYSGLRDDKSAAKGDANQVSGMDLGSGRVK